MFCHELGVLVKSCTRSARLGAEFLSNPRPIWPGRDLLHKGHAMRSCWPYIDRKGWLSMSSSPQRSFPCQPQRALVDAVKFNEICCGFYSDSDNLCVQQLHGSLEGGAAVRNLADGKTRHETLQDSERAVETPWWPRPQLNNSAPLDDCNVHRQEKLHHHQTNREASKTDTSCSVHHQSSH